MPSTQPSSSAAVETENVTFPVFDLAKPKSLTWIKGEWQQDETILRKYAHDGKGNVYYIDLPPLPEAPSS
jgi:hypothetical protein